MKNIIDKFLENNQLAIAGVSPNADNFGRSIMKELMKMDYHVIPVNPKYEEVEGVKTVAAPGDLPADIENLIIMTSPDVTSEIAKACIGTGIKRVWIHRGVGKGSYSEEAHRMLKDNGIEVVYGFCPMMFFGKGMHRFHFKLRKTFGKMPAEFSMN